MDLVLARQLREPPGDARGVPPDRSLRRALTTPPRGHPALAGPLLEPLFEAPGLPAFELPDLLAGLYGGHIGFPPDCLFANFVSSIDGVVAGQGVTPGAISLRSEADRFTMGLLRACAGAVVIGAGTFRPDPRHRWTPAHIYPPAADAFARLRRHLGYPSDPSLVVVTGSGQLGDALDALIPGSLVVTTGAGAAALSGRLPPGAEVVVLGEEGPVPVRAVTRLLAERGHRRVLSEGGPRLFGKLLAEGLVDELFVTLSPVLLGGVLGAVGLAGDVPPWSPGTGAHPSPVSLLGVRRHRSHLFLRYALRGPSPSSPGEAPGR